MDGPAPIVKWKSFGNKWVTLYQEGGRHLPRLTVLVVSSQESSSGTDGSQNE